MYHKKNIYDNDLSGCEKHFLLLKVEDGLKKEFAVELRLQWERKLMYNLTWHTTAIHNHADFQTAFWLATEKNDHIADSYQTPKAHLLLKHLGHGELHSKLFL